jgi:uncharacterized protein
VSSECIIIDTGPLVAYLQHQEAHHAWAEEQFKLLAAPFLTCEPVLVESCHLLRRCPKGAESLFALLDTGIIVVDFNLMDQRQSVSRLIRKYADLPISLADACLVRMAELHDKATVLTLDHHFQIYRKHGRQHCCPDITRTMTTG